MFEGDPPPSYQTSKHQPSPVHTTLVPDASPFSPQLDSQDSQT